MHKTNSVSILALAATATFGQAREATITVHADQVLHRLTPYLTGACIEDVNHEVYGGIDSQMIFGESFAEPSPQPPLKGLEVFGGRWTLGGDGSVRVVGSNGAKMVWDGPGFSEGEVSVDVRLTEAAGGNGGLILKVGDPAEGADAFNGYEVSLERPGILVLGRHRQNWEPLQRVPCEVPVNQWVALTVRTTARTLEVLVNGRPVTRYEDLEHPLEAGRVGLRSWQHDVQFRNLSVATGGASHRIPFEREASRGRHDDVSGMWGGFRQGTAEGMFSLEQEDAFSGRQSQQITFAGGSGIVGIENRSLNRWGMNLVKGRPYQGYVYVRSDRPCRFHVALESMDGGEVHAEQQLQAEGGPWQRLDFVLTPREADRAGRFAIKLKQPGTLSMGYVFLQPGAWGRFKGLPVRKDVAEGLIDQGITVLRQGGCMANAAGYRWKNMIGPRAQRPPYDGWWYPHASNGWGIFEFNAGNHTQRRALANAAAINAIERDGRMPIATSANCLQPDGQNDNDWNQGLLFLNPAQVWLQPPGYVTQMASRDHQPLAVKSTVRATGDHSLDVSATRSEDGRTLVLKVVNPDRQPLTATLETPGFDPRQPLAGVTTLAAPLDSRNTASSPKSVTPERTDWRHRLDEGEATWTFPAHSFTVMRLGSGLVEPE